MTIDMAATAVTHSWPGPSDKSHPDWRESALMLRLANVQVATRLWDIPIAPGHLPASRASSELESASRVALVTEDGSQR